MPGESILDNDELARLLLKPKDQIEIVDPVLKLIRITSNNFQFNTSNDNKESVNCLRLFGDNAPQKCHENGIKKASDNNDRRISVAKEKGTDPVLQKYIGYTAATCSEVKSSSDDYIAFKVEHADENGNYAHCNIKLTLKASLDEKTKKQKTKFKNAAISKLSDQFKRYEAC